MSKREAKNTDFLVPLRQVRNGIALMAIGGDYLIVGAAIAVAVWCDRVWVDVLAIVIIAGRQVALTNLMHAAAHHTLFTPRSWNEKLEFLFAYPILDSVANYRQPHLEHHAEIAKRMENRFEYLHGELRLPERNALGRTWIVFVRGFLGYNGVQLFVGTVKACWSSWRLTGKLMLFWTPILLLCWQAGFIWHLAKFWFLPMFWIYPIFNMWSEISDHFGAEDGRNQVGFFNYLFLKSHEFYHGLHHRFPAVPYYQLHSVRRALIEQGEEVPLSSGFTDFLRAVYCQ